MAGWSKVADGFALDCLKTLQKLQRNDSCFDLEPGSKRPGHGGEEDELRCLFEQLLCFFLKDICGSERFSAFASNAWRWAICGFVQTLLVRLGSGVGSSVKLVYVKYLDTLDRWSMKNTHIWIWKRMVWVFWMSGNRAMTVRLVTRKMGIMGKMIRILIGRESGSVTRECWIGLLRLRRIHVIQKLDRIPERHKWRCYGTEQLWKQVLLAREAIFLERNAGISSEQSNSYWSTKQKMHPSMYDDHIGSEKLRCSVRLVSAKESRSVSSKKSNAPRSCSESSSSTQSDLKDHFDKESTTPLSADSWVGWFSDSHRKRIPVGPLFQAKVLEWTGETYEDDSRWLGSQIWPLKDGESNKHLIERERIGKGRQDSCGCQYPGSTECVRFHTAEKRMRVKLELGLAFHRWKFDKIGEEVALSWTKEEEKKFQAIIKSNPPSLNKCFWDEMFNAFPSKSREDLVSYYFNVYLLQRRGCQNRSTTPSNIDSDDEESEFVLLSNRFGHGAATSRSSIFRSPKKAHLNGR
ncbi:ARID/BRIGHT AND ELM2 DNA-binding domain-containing protein [Actinidia rufa]|uniref:ARID/BRIGHT AND ELM2 DNA-binding domain-containing protein n=1 Tax=Actinidia rufa TaxID=165716 RepID=A0A7J0EV26_9ERIC|nr:ARID/BRIGHT AND ELM2 DNA-binding domain-containing protein [Actinidia rufa]